MGRILYWCKPPELEWRSPSLYLFVSGISIYAIVKIYRRWLGWLSEIFNRLFQLLRSPIYRRQTIESIWLTWPWVSDENLRLQRCILFWRGFKRIQKLFNINRNFVANIIVNGDIKCLVRFSFFAASSRWKFAYTKFGWRSMAVPSTQSLFNDNVCVSGSGHSRHSCSTNSLDAFARRVSIRGVRSKER